MLRGIAGPAVSRRLLGEVPPVNWRPLAALIAIIVISVLLRLMTWDAIADGSQPRYVKTALLGGCAAAVVWWLVRLQVGTHSRGPLLAAAAVLLSGDAVHYVRLAHPITRGGAVQSLVTSFEDEATVRRQWDVDSTGAGQVLFEQGAVRLESPPQAAAYVQARLPRLPDVRVNWWLPVGLAERARTEHVTWRASVKRSETFYAMAELRQLLIQIVSYGVHITYPDEGKVMRGHEIVHPAGSDGLTHAWQLTRDQRQVSLSIDGQQVWSTLQQGELNQIKLGETKNDPQHGGSMRLEHVRYTSALERR